MTSDLPPDAGRSWWLREALAADPGEPAPPLAGDAEADVVILGGGYTGMWTALHLTEREPGMRVVILEQDICGGGPSGRNGGFVNSWWSGVAELAERVGDEAALALCRAGTRAVNGIEAFCSAHGVDAWFTRAGDMGVVTNEANDGAWRANVEAAERLGMASQVRELSAEETRGVADSPTFRGGLIDHEGVTVQPARLARGMRRVLLERNVRIFEHSPVTRFGPGRPSTAETPGGRVRAGAAVIALNAWASAWKRFRRSLIVRGSYIVLTAPAPDKLEEIGWTGEESIWDFRAALHYLRTTKDGRIAFGIGGMQPGLARTIGPAFAHDERSIRVAAEDLWRMFPPFRDVPLEAAWGGPIDVAGHHLPYVGRLDTGDVHYAHGYTGNGVGPSHLVGELLAGRVLGTPDAALEELPIATMEPMRFPPAPIRAPGALVVNTAIRRKDETEDRGEEPNPIVDFMARLPRRLGYNLGP
jgi:glycine/D-amino acid oxidase-like deaminating enzyme